MKTLTLRNGDLALGPGGHQVATGVTKLRQDLGVLVREELGVDRFHPSWGTILPRYVGGTADPELAMYVRSEVNRLLQNYIAAQTLQMEADATAGRRPRYTSDEILAVVDGVQVQTIGTRLNVKVTVRTAAGSTATILRTVEA